MFYRKFILIFLWIFSCSFIDFEYKNIKTNEPLSIHILEINPKKYEIKLTLAKENEISVDTVLNISKNHKAKAAINGGFFKMGNSLDGLPAGNLKVNGVWISLDQIQRAALGWNNGSSIFFLDKLDIKPFIILENEQQIPIDGINRPIKENERILYLSNFFHLYKVKPSNLKSFMVMSQNYFLATSPNDFLIDIIRPNTFKYIIQINPIFNIEYKKIWENLDNILGGTPLLIFNGKKIEDYSSERTCETFLNEKHARTAFGIKENGNLIFLAVDANDPFISIGMTIDELRDFLFNIGCKYAINLDGGGSTAMVIDNIIVNQPKKDEDDVSCIKKVSNAILIFDKLN